MLIVRSRLLEQLEEGIHRALTLISAPAGFGKTTLLIDWSQSKTQAIPEANGLVRTGWLSLDEDDNDPNRFWLYLVTALQRTGLDLEASVLSLLRISQPPPIKTILTLLINELETISGDLVLVLDDYHLINAQPIHDGLTYLILHLPIRFHIVISTRADPPFPLSRLRVQKQLTEIRAADLMFTESEMEAFLREAVGVSLSPEDISALAAHTEGWAAGLQLAALSMRGHEDHSRFITHLAGNQRYILDYLIDEVIGRLDPGRQVFLERTAILNRMCAPLCDWIMMQPDESLSSGASPSASQTLLEELERSNLFLTPLDGERHWFRYHRLFAECLVARLEQSHPDLLPRLHRRAGEWFERQGMLEEALRHSFAAHDLEWAAKLVERCIPQALDQGYLTKIMHWKDALPHEIIASRPRLCLLLAQSLAESGKFDQSEGYLHIVEAGLRAQDLPEQEVPRWMLAGICSSIALSKGNAPSALRLSHEALAGIPDEETGWRGLMTLNLGFADFLLGNISRAAQELNQALELGIQSRNLKVILTAPIYLMNVQILLLELSQVEATCQRILHIIAELLGSTTLSIPALSTVYLTLAKVRNERNDLESAEALILKAIELAEQSGSLDTILSCAIRLASLRADQGRVQDGIAILAEKVAGLREKNDLLRLIQAEAAMAFFRLQAGEVQKVAEWLDSMPEDTFLRVGFIPELIKLLMVLLRRAQGRYVEALQIADPLLADAKESGRTGRILELQVYRSTLLDAKGDATQVNDALYEALILGHPENILRPFIYEGAPMKRLLERIQIDPRVVTNTSLREYIAQILTAFHVEMGRKQPASVEHAPDTLSGGTSPSTSANDRLVEPLTARELDILRLMARGTSNQEIAQELIISLGTVKAHTSHIQGKLGTRNRTETVVRARELGLLTEK